MTEYKPASTLIAESLLVAPAASFSFTNIPATFRHLQLELQVRSDRAAANTDEVGMRFNNDTGNNYDWQRVYGTNTTVAADRALAGNSAYIGACPAALSTAARANGCSVKIPNYAGTTFRKMYAVLNAARDNGAADTVMFDEMLAGTWFAAVAAINRIDIFSRNGVNFVAGSLVSLYGLR